MSTNQRLRAAREFIESGPVVEVDVVWVGYSHKKNRTELRGMSKFPALPSGGHSPVVVIDGEVIRAVAYVNDCRPIDSPGQEVGA